MKKAIINCTGVIIAILIAAIMFSCEYKEIASADYPEPMLYFPVAYNGIYVIDELTKDEPNNPTKGSVYRYKIDPETGNFDIPLAGYRSGLNPGPEVSISISADTDTVFSLIAGGELPDVKILPENTYSIVSPDLKMKNGGTLAEFKVSVNFAFLQGNTPQKYAFALKISSSEQKINPDLDTVIVLIDTKIIN